MALRLLLWTGLGTTRWDVLGQRVSEDSIFLRKWVRLTDCSTGRELSMRCLAEVLVWLFYLLPRSSLSLFRSSAVRSCPAADCFLHPLFISNRLWLLCCIVDGSFLILSSFDLSMQLILTRWMYYDYHGLCLWSMRFGFILIWEINGGFPFLFGLSWNSCGCYIMEEEQIDMGDTGSDSSCLGCVWNIRIYSIIAILQCSAPTHHYSLSLGQICSHTQ